MIFFALVAIGVTKSQIQFQFEDVSASFFCLLSRRRKAWIRETMPSYITCLKLSAHNLSAIMNRILTVSEKIGFFKQQI